MSAGLVVVVAVGGLASGVLSRSFPSSWPYLCVGVLLGVSALLWRRPQRGACLLVVLVTASFSLGTWRMASFEAHFDARARVLAPYERQDITFEGVVVRDPESRETSVVLVVVPEGSNHRIRVSTDRTFAAAYGDRVLVEGMLERPVAFESELGRMFPYAEYLRAHGITHTVSFARVETIAHGGGHMFLRALFSLKHRFAESVSALLPEPHASLALGLLLGEKQGIGERLEDVFRTVGIIHIIVLSGYNLTIIAEALMRILMPVLLPRPRAIVGAIAIVIFALMVGPSATVARATVMALLVLFARATGRTYDALRALLLAGALMVFLNPYALAFDPGFQFSYLATLGLILLGPLVDRVVSFLPSYAGIREYVTATIATQIAVAPLLLWSIGAVSIIAILANTLILVMVPLAMLLVFVAGLVGLIAPGLIFIAYPAYLALSYILSIARLLAGIPYAEVVVPPFPFWIVAVLYVALGSLLLALVRRKNPDEANASSGFFSRGRV